MSTPFTRRAYERLDASTGPSIPDGPQYTPPTRAEKSALSYHARRQWQNEARARGEVPECGRAACDKPAAPAWVNQHTPLLYCGGCATAINWYNPGLCSLEVT